MYNHSSTLMTRPRRNPRSVMLVMPNIQILNVNEDCFYSALSTTINGPLVILRKAVESETIPCINTKGLLGLSASVYKSSVIFMYADKRGVYLEYHAANKENNFTLFVQWKELDVMNPSESNFTQYLAYLKTGMLSKHFLGIVSKGSKARKAVFKAIDSISTSLYERFCISNTRYIETSYTGGWVLIKTELNTRHEVLLEQLTISDFA